MSSDVTDWHDIKTFKDLMANLFVILGPEQTFQTILVGFYQRTCPVELRIQKFIKMSPLKY